MNVQRLVSLPLAMSPHFARLENKPEPTWVASSDPSGPIGSGGGTAHLLADSWRRTGASLSFREWLRDSQKIIVHSGGQSRRLPAYATVGKALMPMPVLRGSVGQKLDQTLLDLQISEYERIMSRAPSQLRVMVTAGDVMIRLRKIPHIPVGDVVSLGMTGTEEEVSHFGVFFQDRTRPDVLDFFRQKPSPEITATLYQTHDFLLDIGVWMLSEDAAMLLMEQCGWDDAAQAFKGNTPGSYELYSGFGLAMGANPTEPDEVLSNLSSKVVPCDGSFVHFGTSRQMIDGVTQLHDQSQAQDPLGFITIARRKQGQHVQNAHFDGPPPFKTGNLEWVENSDVHGWSFGGDNVVTGAKGISGVSLPEGICVDMAPVLGGGTCVRVYGFDDKFSGALGDATTLWMGSPASEWFSDRNLPIPDAEIDIQKAPLFPIVHEYSDINILLEWMLDPSKAGKEVWERCEKVSGSDLLSRTDIEQIYTNRSEQRATSLQTLLQNHSTSVFYRLDLEAAAQQAAETDLQLDLTREPSLIKRMHGAMFESARLRAKGSDGWESQEAEAFKALREMLVDTSTLRAEPKSTVQDQQIVWGRSPLRLDLAGGWTDTPPYCLLHGGRVLNVAVDINGQPPVQVFARRIAEPHFVLRSIDLGTEERVTEYGGLESSAAAGSEFSLAKIALALSGFSPSFGARGNTLQQTLKEFGGGIEISLLAAVPKGSGLGTSSILAATILGVLNDFCGLDWTNTDLFRRTLALEQILTTGGGWQDQAGGCIHGLKILETTPGIEQAPTCRWLPERVLGPSNANSMALLYYTGITRMAASVLREIVRGMFLNSGTRLSILREIYENVVPCADAIQREDFDALGAAIATSWDLNQRLDSGTNPPSVQILMNSVQDYILGGKLLGAGGGGYLLLLAKDADAAHRIRETLAVVNPAPGARFVRFEVSGKGLEVTRS